MRIVLTPYPDQLLGAILGILSTAALEEGS